MFSIWQLKISWMQMSTGPHNYQILPHWRLALCKHYYVTIQCNDVIDIITGHIIKNLSLPLFFKSFFESNKLKSPWKIVCSWNLQVGGRNFLKLCQAFMTAVILNHSFRPLSIIRIYLQRDGPHPWTSKTDFWGPRFSYIV